MKKYESPEVEVLKFTEEILTASPAEGEGTQTTQIGQTGIWDLNHGA